MKTKLPDNNKTRTRRGQAAVEFALTISILLLLLLGILEVSRLIFINSAVENGAREGVRFASVNPPGTSRYNSTLLKNAVTSKMALVDGNSVVVNVQSGALCDFCPITVTVSYPWNPLVSFVGIGAINLTSSSTMLIQNSR